ncbi:MAG: preprotein translocase subunit SecG [Lentisphaeria bacterium]|nr:preprotein translocase subunit SecG [Lentisphaeria bacterium]
MTFWAVILYAAVILVAILLIALVLVQQSKGGGFGGAFGGLGESILGAQAGSHLTKLTVILSSIFFVLVLAIAILISHGGATKSSDSAVDALVQKAAAQTETAAKTAAPAAADVKEKTETPVKK